MNAIFQAKKMYEARGLNFEQDLGHYLTQGIVVSQPDRFLMAKPVRKEIGEKDWHPETPDCWHVHIAIGKGCLRWFFEQAPFFLPFVSFSRSKCRDGGKMLRVYPTEKLKRIA